MCTFYYFLCFLGYFKYFIVFFSKLIKTSTIYLLILWSYCRTQNSWFIRWTKFSCTSYTAVSLGVVSKKIYWSINMSFCVDLNPSRSRCLRKTCERFPGGDCLWSIKRRTRRRQVEPSICTVGLTSGAGEQEGRRTLPWRGASDCKGWTRLLGCSGMQIACQRSPMLCETGSALLASLGSASGGEQPQTSLALQQMQWWVQRRGSEDPSAGTQSAVSQPVLSKELQTEHFCSCTSCTTQTHFLQDWGATPWLPCTQWGIGSNQYSLSLKGNDWYSPYLPSSILNISHPQVLL